MSAFAFADGPLRFSDIEARLDASPSTLTERQKESTATGLLDRRASDEVPSRVEYEATDGAEAS